MLAPLEVTKKYWTERKSESENIEMGITESENPIQALLSFFVCYNLLNRYNFKLTANQAGSNILTSIFWGFYEISFYITKIKKQLFQKNLTMAASILPYVLAINFRIKINSVFLFKISRFYQKDCCAWLFDLIYKATLLESHFGMDVLL